MAQKWRVTQLAPSWLCRTITLLHEWMAKLQPENSVFQAELLEIHETIICAIAQNVIKAHKGHLGNEKADQLEKRATIEGTAFNLQKPASFLKKALVQLSLEIWQREWEEGTTSCHTYDVLPKVALISRHWSRNEILLVTGHDPFPSYFKRFGLAVWDNCACGDVGIPFHYATACPLTLSFHFKTPSAIHKLAWIGNLVSNPHATRRLKILFLYHSDI
ncbi:hypothetical protein AVEN_115829-1 [Araneus ventricosus]|uniref:RNase H type-1 domain-containing protein n=1 Tax=Araneus ventricosus TaxID=182803 RepID=A0A4Y2TB07_ARAVE|nr:hypothetical protein AVEN_115829-1 [Araneus ventricosus]